jgi:hypothetical protein
MRDLPLFDSLTHPTLDGKWISGAPGNNTLSQLEAEMDANNVGWACAVGMKGIGDYELAAYADHIRSASKKIFPVAYYDFNESDSAREINRQLDDIHRCGYSAIKIHPRFSRINLRGPGLRAVLFEAGARGLPVLLCTFLYGQPPLPPFPYQEFGPLLSDLPADARVILLHGGDVNVRGLMEIIQPYPKILLDLSFTLCRYQGSSVDLDIRHLFDRFDDRICVGSDNPQFSLAKFRRRFNELSDGVELEKRLNVAHRNLRSIFDGPSVRNP